MKKTTVKRIRLAVLIVFGVLIFAFLAINLFMFGGVSGILRSAQSTKDPIGTTVSSARVKAKTQIDTAFDTFSQNNPSFTQISPIGTYDECGKGSHSWKRNDGFVQSCEILVTRFYQFDGDFSSIINNLAKALDEQGWIANPNNKLQSVAKLYDQYKETGTGFDTSYTVNDLPEVDNYKKDDLIARFRFTDVSSPDVTTLIHTEMFASNQTRGHMSIGVGNRFWEEDQSISLTDVITASNPDKRFILSLTLAKTYYRK